MLKSSVRTSTRGHEAQCFFKKKPSTRFELLRAAALALRVAGSASSLSFELGPAVACLYGSFRRLELRVVPRGGRRRRRPAAAARRRRGGGGGAAGRAGRARAAPRAGARALLLRDREPALLHRGGARRDARRRHLQEPGLRALGHAERGLHGQRASSTARAGPTRARAREARRRRARCADARRRSPRRAARSERAAPRTTNVPRRAQRTCRTAPRCAGELARFASARTRARSGAAAAAAFGADSAARGSG